jgi:signal peptidase II
MGERPMTGKTPLVRGLAVALVVLLLDQATKWWIVAVVMQPPQVIPVTSFFNLVLGWNRGISFGLFNSDSPYNALIFTALASVVIAILVYLLRRAERWWTMLAIGLVVGGAVGNVVDRLRFGGVADFLDFHIAGYHWPAFNVADSGITVGAAVLALDFLFEGAQTPKKDEKTKTDGGT